MTIFKGVPWFGGLKIGWGGFQLRGTISWRRCEIKLRSQLITNINEVMYIGLRLDKWPWIWGRKGRLLSVVPTSCSVLLNNMNITKRCLPKLFISVKITKLAHHVVHKRQTKLRSKPTSTLPALCHWLVCTYLLKIGKYTNQKGWNQSYRNTYHYHKHQKTAISNKRN